MSCLDCETAMFGQCGRCADLKVARELEIPPLLLAAEPRSTLAGSLIDRLTASRDLDVVAIRRVPRDVCACGVDLTELQAEGKYGHMCPKLRVELVVPDFSVPTSEVRESLLETSAREFAEVCPSLSDLMLRGEAGKHLDHKRISKHRGNLYAAALRLAASYIRERHHTDEHVDDTYHGIADDLEELADEEQSE